MLLCFVKPPPPLLSQVLGNPLISPEIGLPCGQYLTLALCSALLYAGQCGPRRLDLVLGSQLFVVVEIAQPGNFAVDATGRFGLSLTL